ncbi:GNAT family N-acetyltransferase [Thioclava nitratireducens]|uniref:GNAT family N-acetyltransferase n=1 Tax=Thioclava nitratireducens TaxID=1915078 RepID=UPI00248105FB|nr:GNAT family N-acetyltransferase [Thioclava nitratireducens]WGT51489.1 GNAT family N-acetyltransferase [Thioclava nitratireducens]
MTQVAPLEVSGVRLKLRLVRPDDAAYIHALRTDAAYNAHLSAVTGTVEDQRHWIEAYKRREAEGVEYYYVVERLDDARRCGLVRLYEIENEHFTWGSWILDKNKPSKAALESAVLSFGIGFGQLEKTVAKIDVRQENSHATTFYRRFGMVETGRDMLNIYFDYTRERYETDREEHLAVLKE